MTEWEQAIVCICYWLVHCYLTGNRRLRRHLKEKYTCGPIHNVPKVWKQFPYYNPFDEDWLLREIRSYQDN